MEHNNERYQRLLLAVPLATLLSTAYVACSGDIEESGLRLESTPDAGRDTHVDPTGDVLVWPEMSDALGDVLDDVGDAIDDLADDGAPFSGTG